MAIERDPYTELKAPIEAPFMTISKKDGRIRYQYDGVKIFLPQPFGDEQLAALPPQERADYMRGMAISYWQFDLEKRYPLLFKPRDPEEKHPEKVRPVPEFTPTLLLASLVEELKIHDKLAHHAEGRLQNINVLYEGEKDAIRNGLRGKHGKERKVQATHKEWNPKIEAGGKRLATEQALSNTALDIVAKEFFLTPGGPQQLILAVQDLRGCTYCDQLDIEVVLTAVKKRIETAKSEYAQLFGYKEGNGNLIDEQQATVLKQLIELANPTTDPKDSLEGIISEVAETLLNFYWKNIDKLYPTEENTPRMAFVYDYFFAAASSENPNLLFRCSEWLSRKISSCPEIFQKEHLLTLNGMLQEKRLMYARLVEAELVDPSTYCFLGSSDDNREKLRLFNESFLQQSHKRYVAEKDWDRYQGISATYGVLGSWGQPNHIQRLLGDLKERVSGSDRDLFSYHELIGNAIADWETIYRDNYLQDTLGGYTSRYFNRDKFLKLWLQVAGVARDYFKTTENPFQTILDSRDITTPGRERITTNTILRASFSKTETPSTPEDLVRMQEGNSEILWKIYQENMWFVALNGDEFPATRDPELERLGLISLTLYPDPETHGGHKVVIMSQLKEAYAHQAMSILYIDKNGRLLRADRNPFNEPYFIYLPLQRLILDRLYFISSGILSDKTKAEPHQGETGKEIVGEISRRAFWRPLISTDRITYTMNSYTAKQHAAFVLAKRGINIYTTILDRRRNKTLGPNDFITYVMESDVEGTPPNILRYFPVPPDYKPRT